MNLLHVKPVSISTEDTATGATGGKMFQTKICLDMFLSNIFRLGNPVNLFHVKRI